MPWRIKRELWIYACGFGALGLGIAVIVRDRSLDTRLLGFVGLLAGIAIVFANLPANGHPDDERPP